MSGVRRQRGGPRARPREAVAGGEEVVVAQDEGVALLVEGDGGLGAQGLVVEVGDARRRCAGRRGRRGCDEVEDRTVRRTSGWALAKAAVRREAGESAVGMTLMRRVPERPCGRRAPPRAWRGVGDDAAGPGEDSLAFGVRPLVAGAAADEEDAEGSSSCRIAAERVGCATPSASAARPKWRAEARAMNISSLSIIGGTRGSAGRAPAAGDAEEAQGEGSEDAQEGGGAEGRVSTSARTTTAAPRRAARA
jgi:hypothetical protein